MPAIIRAVFPTVADPVGWATFLNAACTRRKVARPTYYAAFLAQVGHESARFTRLRENMNYAADKLVPVFGAHRISQATAARIGRIATRPADQQAIANTVYGGEWGRKNLGNTEPGDGWRFRGRGLIQITGRANYAKCAEGVGRSLDDLPAWLETPEGAAESAAWWWQEHGCNGFVDAEDFPGLTRRINGGTIGLAERTALWEQAKLALV